MSTPETVTADHLRRLATVDPDSMFRDADTLVTSDEGLTIVPFRLVEGALAGQNRFVHWLVFSRSDFADAGVRVGRRPRMMDGGDLDAHLAKLAAELNEMLAVGASPETVKETAK